MASLPRIFLAVGAVLTLGGAPDVWADVAPVSVSANVQVNSRAAAQATEDFKSPAVAINPNDASDVVIASRNDIPDFGCQVHYSVDGGATWTAAVFPPAPLGPCWSPGVAFADANRVYVAAQNRKPGGGRPQTIVVWSSSDGGATFGAPVTIPASTVGDANAFSLQAGITVDTQPASPHRGRIYVVWYHGFPSFPSVRVFLSFSDDGGATWSAGTTMPPGPGVQQFHPTPTVGPDGTVYVVYKNGNSNDCTGFGFGNPAPGTPSECPVRLLRSSDGGQTFDLDVQVAPAHYTDLSQGEAPGITTTPGGAVLVTFASLPGQAAPGCPRDLDAFVTRSTDRGVNWSEPTRVNDDACTSGASQRDPWMSTAANGRVDAIWYDNRNDPSHVRYDVLYASSADGGQGFGPSVRLTDRTFDPAYMFSPKMGFQSNEYDQVNGIASTNAGAVGAWGDSRNAIGAASTVSDIFSVRIGVGSAPAPMNEPVPVVAPTAPVVADTVAPVVTDYRVTKRGTRFTYTLSEPATTKIVIARRRSGRRSGRRCVAPTRKLRKAKPCRRITVRTTLTRMSRQGKNSVAYSGAKALRPGRYQATLTATDAAGNASKSQTVSFAIVARRA